MEIKTRLLLEIEWRVIITVMLHIFCAFTDYIPVKIQALELWKKTFYCKCNISQFEAQISSYPWYKYL